MDRDQRDAQFTDFVAARSRALLGTAFLLTGHRQRGEDLLQTALLKTYLAWPRLRETRAVEAYVRRTMVTTNISWWRRRWRGEVPTADLPDRVQPDPSETRDLHSELWSHLVSLPPRQRTAVVQPSGLTDGPPDRQKSLPWPFRRPDRDFCLSAGTDEPRDTGACSRPRSPRWTCCTRT